MVTMVEDRGACSSSMVFEIHAAPLEEDRIACSASS